MLLLLTTTQGFIFWHWPWNLANVTVFMKTLQLPRFSSYWFTHQKCSLNLRIVSTHGWENLHKKKCHPQSHLSYTKQAPLLPWHLLSQVAHPSRHSGSLGQTETVGKLHEDFLCQKWVSLTEHHADLWHLRHLIWLNHRDCPKLNFKRFNGVSKTIAN